MCLCDFPLQIDVFSNEKRNVLPVKSVGADVPFSLDGVLFSCRCTKRHEVIHQWF